MLCTTAFANAVLATIAVIIAIAIAAVAVWRSFLSGRLCCIRRVGLIAVACALGVSNHGDMRMMAVAGTGWCRMRIAQRRVGNASPMRHRRRSPIEGQCDAQHQAQKERPKGHESKLNSIG